MKRKDTKHVEQDDSAKQDKKERPLLLLQRLETAFIHKAGQR